MRGWAYIEPMLCSAAGSATRSSFASRTPSSGELQARSGTGLVPFMLHGLSASRRSGSPLAGIATASYLLPGQSGAARDASQQFPAPLYTLLDNKYYFDRFNDWFFAGGARAVGRFASNVGDRTIIDGSSSTARRGSSAWLRR